MIDENTALYDVMGMSAASGVFDLIGQISIVVPKNRHDLELAYAWEVEPLGTVEGTNYFGAKLEVPAVRFWRYAAERYANQQQSSHTESKMPRDALCNSEQCREHLAVSFNKSFADEGMPDQFLVSGTRLLMFRHSNVDPQVRLEQGKKLMANNQFVQWLRTDGFTTLVLSTIDNCAEGQYDNCLHSVDFDVPNTVKTPAN
jgi:hypothetical protein